MSSLSIIQKAAIGVGALFCVTVLFGAVQPRDEPAYDPVKAHHEHPEQVVWSHNGIGNLGITGTFDRAQLQRGFQVYRQVCSACHSISRVSFRDLTALGYSEDQAKVIASEYEVPAIDNDGEAIMREASLADKFPSVYPNEAAARAAQGGAYPPDLSLITKARHDGTNYVRSLLLGYRDDVPEDFNKADTLWYNPWFSSLALAMPPPLIPDAEQVEYTDGTPMTVDNYAADVAVFLTWTAEPKLENRKETGIAAIGFLIIMTILGYLSYKKIWSDLKKPKLK
jgi:ubiquinol-cytochrome c reductase cytochrome c1 subunit